MMKTYSLAMGIRIFSYQESQDGYFQMNIFYFQDQMMQLFKDVFFSRTSSKYWFIYCESFCLSCRQRQDLATCELFILEHYFCNERQL